MRLPSAIKKSLFTESYKQPWDLGYTMKSSNNYIRLKTGPTTCKLLPPGLCTVVNRYILSVLDTQVLYTLSLVDGTYLMQIMVSLIYNGAGHEIGVLIGSLLYFSASG